LKSLYYDARSEKHQITLANNLPKIHYSFIHSAVCLTTGPQNLPKPVLHTVWSSASSFNLQYPIQIWLRLQKLVVDAQRNYF